MSKPFSASVPAALPRWSGDLISAVAVGKEAVC
jgi:hypothetical protein